MQTRYFTAQDSNWPANLILAADCLRRGGLVALPTETVYGLGANALDERAVAKIFEAKGRPSDNPLIVHIADIDALYALVRETSEAAQLLMSTFWPGALTLVMKKADDVPLIVTAGLDTVAVRMPAHPVALEIIRSARVPIAAPSANRSGRPSPTDAAHVAEDLDGLIDIIVDGGACSVGVESTVLDVTVTPPMILRPGAITREMLEAVIGEVSVDPALFGKSREKPKSPGMKYRHYAPNAPMIVFAGEICDMVRAIQQNAEKTLDQSPEKRIVILCTDETIKLYRLSNAFLVSMGSREHLETVAQAIFSILRECDSGGTDQIFCEGFTDAGVGHAVMNRLTKAAGGQLIRLPNLESKTDS